MEDQPSSPADAVRPLLRVRQVRQFTDAPVTDEQLDAIADAGRWSGSSQNKQPWRFILLQQGKALSEIAEAGLPHTRALTTAAAAIAIVMPEQSGRAVSNAYDEGRAAERILIAASFCGLAGGIGWINAETRQAVSGILRLPEDRFVRTVVAIGHPTVAARRPKSPRGEARLPREDTVFRERWPD
jgi:nitroreductase